MGVLQEIIRNAHYGLLLNFSILILQDFDQRFFYVLCQGLGYLSSSLFLNMTE